LQPDKAKATPTTRTAAPERTARDVKGFCDVMGRYSPSSFKTACSEQ
jgi:hypothetical protein